MASSENLASIEPWTFRSTFADSWMFEAFNRDTEALTKALQKSIAGAPDIFVSDSISPFFDLIKPDTAPTPTISGISGGSDPETVPKRQRNAIPAVTGKVSKRKSRASKRTQTTFITADPANFRQMVQQVTGVRFGNSQLPAAPILKPEPHRPGSRLTGGGYLPTLDTSAYLLDHQQQQLMGTNMADGPSSLLTGSRPLSFGAPMGVAEGGSVGLDFETFSSFPTLESWKVM